MFVFFDLNLLLLGREKKVHTGWIYELVEFLSFFVEFVEFVEFKHPGRWTRASLHGLTFGAKWIHIIILRSPVSPYPHIQ